MTSFTVDGPHTNTVHKLGSSFNTDIFSAIQARAALQPVSYLSDTRTFDGIIITHNLLRSSFNTDFHSAIQARAALQPVSYLSDTRTFDGIIVTHNLLGSSFNMSSQWNTYKLRYTAHHGSYPNAVHEQRSTTLFLTANSKYILRPVEHCHRFFPTANHSQIQWPFSLCQNGHTVTFLIL